MGGSSRPAAPPAQTADTNYIANPNPSLPMYSGGSPTLAAPYGTPAAPTPNIFTAAQQGITGAGLGAAGEMGYQPGQVQAGQLATTSMTPYMNPYTEQVIKANEADILRGAQMGLNTLGAPAQAARAFGGSRQGVAEAELGRNVLQQLAQSSAGLRQAGYTQAQSAAQQDIANALAAQQFNVGSGLQGQQARLAAGSQLANIANLGFGMGQTVQQNLAQQGTQQQALQQALIDAARGQYAGYTGAPATSLGYLAQALGATPVPQSTTTSKQPGLFDYLTLGAVALPAIGRGYSAYTAAMAPVSDIRLKKDIKQIGELSNGLKTYSWKWNQKAKDLGVDHFPTIGVIAQEAQKVVPHAVIEGADGYLRVNYVEIL
jgi:hypothetical protein